MAGYPGVCTTCAKMGRSVGVPPVYLKQISKQLRPGFNEGANSIWAYLWTFNKALFLTRVRFMRSITGTFVLLIHGGALLQTTSGAHYASLSVILFDLRVIWIGVQQNKSRKRLRISLVS